MGASGRVGSKCSTPATGAPLGVTLEKGGWTLL